MQDGIASDHPRIVVIGGGTGLSVMLRSLKTKPLQITAIVTVGDDGGSSGILRSEMQIPPPGDICDVLTALADAEPILTKLLAYRFSAGNGLAGHSMGNLLLAAMKEITGDFVSGIKELSRVLAVRGRVLPASEEAFILKAELADGRIIEGESQIPKARGRIKRVFIDTPNLRPLDEALEALAEADAILFGPGSLYTSIIPNLLVPGLSDAIAQSSALKIYVCNIMSQPGETDGYTVSDHIKAIYQHAGHEFFDVCIVNNGAFHPEVLTKYAEQGAAPVKIDAEAIASLNCDCIADTLAQYRTYFRHDSEKLGYHIVRLVKERMTGMR